jgi:hypothetical protein
MQFYQPSMESKIKGDKTSEILSLEAPKIISFRRRVQAKRWRVVRWYFTLLFVFIFSKHSVRQILESVHSELKYYFLKRDSIEVEIPQNIEILLEIKLGV